VHESGIHATIAGVALGLLVPSAQRSGERAEAPLERLERALHPWSAYLVLPLFALANAGVSLSGNAISDAAASRVTLGIVVGLVAGKLVGISLTTWLATRLRLAELPSGMEWRHVIGVAMLAGVGFTVSLFVSALAFDDAQRVQDAKIGIFAASLLAGTIGYCYLRLVSSVEQAEAAPA
jgi:NhaA family Na+:H+ antiporter